MIDLGIVHQLLRQHPLRRQRCRRNQAMRLQGMKRLPLIPHQPGRPPNTGYRLQLGYQRRCAQVGQHALERPAHESTFHVCRLGCNSAAATLAFSAIAEWAGIVSARLRPPNAHGKDST